MSWHEEQEAQLQADLVSEKWDDDLREFAPWRVIRDSRLRAQALGTFSEEVADHDRR